jgi:hypothetical protein
VPAAHTELIAAASALRDGAEQTGAEDPRTGRRTRPVRAAQNAAIATASTTDNEATHTAGRTIDA